MIYDQAGKPIMPRVPKGYQLNFVTGQIRRGEPRSVPVDINSHHNATRRRALKQIRKG